RSAASPKRGGFGPLDPVALPVRRAARGNPGGASGATAGSLVPGSSWLLRPAGAVRRWTRRGQRPPPALRVPRGGGAVGGAGDAVRAGPRAPQRLADRARCSRLGPRASRELGGVGQKTR